MSAITEIPAKTPKPIGRTDSFLPGSVNGVDDALAAEFSAAAVPDCAVEEVVDVPETAEASVAVGDAATLEENETLALLVETPVEADTEAAVVTLIDSVTDVVPSTEKAGFALADPDGTEDEIEMDAGDVVNDGVAVGRIGMLSVSAVGVALAVGVAAAPLEDTETVQSFTSITSGFPLASVVGVKVIVQVSMTVPSGVTVEVTDCTVSGPLNAPVCLRATFPPASL